MILCFHRPKFHRVFAFVDPKPIGQGVIPVNLLSLMKPDCVFVGEQALAVEMHVFAYNCGDIVRLCLPAGGTTPGRDSSIF